MTPRLFVLSAISAALFSTYASAIGFGEILLSSRVGEPLRAEVPVFTNTGEPIDPACFTLSPVPGSDLPVVSSARIKLIQRGQAHFLSITGSKPIAEPMFVISLRANCGIDLQRDFILMPQAPLMLMASESDAPAPPAAPAPTATRKRSSTYSELRAQDGDTLESIAESRSSGDIVEQQRLLAAMQRANPGLSPDQPLPEGETVLIPRVRRPVPAEAISRYDAPPKPRRAEQSIAPQAKPKKAPLREASPIQASNNTDRVILGAPPEEVKPGEKAVAPRGSLQEADERMLKLEASLNLLSREVEKLNSALALATEALAVQEKLRDAQASQVPPAGTPTLQASPPPAATQERSNHNNWLELLVSALIGGGIAAGAAHLISRQRGATTARDELPTRATSRNDEVLPQVQNTAEPLFNEIPDLPEDKVDPASPTEVDIPLDGDFSGIDTETETTVNVSENDSILELAEIMLSFGRIRGAAETLALHIEERSPDNIQPWSMLLDLYRRGEMHVEFESLAAKMRSKFNVRIPSWEDSAEPVSGLKSLEDYAHIIGRAIHTWGTQDCLDYLYELVHNNRAGQRSGFPLEVVEEIALLILVLESGYGIRRP